MNCYIQSSSSQSGFKWQKVELSKSNSKGDYPTNYFQDLIAKFNLHNKFVSLIKYRDRLILWIDKLPTHRKVLDGRKISNNLLFEFEQKTEANKLNQLLSNVLNISEDSIDIFNTNFIEKIDSFFSEEIQEYQFDSSNFLLWLDEIFNSTKVGNNSKFKLEENKHYFAKFNSKRAVEILNVWDTIFFENKDDFTIIFYIGESSYFSDEDSPILLLTTNGFKNIDWHTRDTTSKKPKIKNKIYDELRDCFLNIKKKNV